MLVKEMKVILGSAPGTGNTKMGCMTWGYSNTQCQTGGKLAKIEGTPCNICYMNVIERLRPSVGVCFDRRIIAMRRALHWGDEGKRAEWIEAMVFAIERYVARNPDNRFFRVFDGGDLQSREEFAAWCEVARRNPLVSFWMATQEFRFVKRYLRGGGEIPVNLVVRHSTQKNDRPNRSTWTHKSEVWSKENLDEARSRGTYVCPASLKRGGSCVGEGCRACWDPAVLVVGYKAH